MYNSSGSKRNKSKTFLEVFYNLKKGPENDHMEKYMLMKHRKSSLNSFVRECHSSVEYQSYGQYVHLLYKNEFYCLQNQLKNERGSHNLRLK